MVALMEIEDVCAWIIIDKDCVLVVGSVISMCLILGGVYVQIFLGGVFVCGHQARSERSTCMNGMYLIE
jgi:hypothetical protein